jgi:predicted metal-binding protein
MKIQEELRSYPGPWKGELVLVCRKCQKRLQQDGGNKKLARLRKTLRKRARRLDDSLDIYAVDVPCLKMCPKDGVTVCTGAQAAGHECSIVRSLTDVDVLIGSLERPREPPAHS